MKNKSIRFTVCAFILIIVIVLVLVLSGSPKPETASAAPVTFTAASVISTDAPKTNEYGILDTSEMFTERDIIQTPSLEDAVTYTVSDNSDIHITEEGIYILTGTASNAVIYVKAEDNAKVQLVLDSLSVSNNDFPCIYVISGDKVFITTLGDSDLSVTGTFRADGGTNTDGVIFSRSDIVLNGTALLTINSSENGIVSKDDMKITGGSYSVNAADTALEANDSILILDGTFNLTAGTDGLHAENDDDDTLGYICICGGTITISANDDAIHATSVLQIDDGTIQLSGAEGLESTFIQINGGSISISSWDDGINAASKSSTYTTGLEINGGQISISMGSGDTDGIDSNGNLTINGGTVDITGSSSFDVDGNAQYNGGTIIVNGTQIDYIPTMGGMNGMGGSRGGGNGGRMR